MVYLVTRASLVDPEKLLDPTEAGVQIARTITGTTNEIDVANGDGIAGNPVLSLSATIGAAKAFRRGNILGSVSQSGGVPTGALIEGGSNANGRYLRLADGTQICWASPGTQMVATTVATGGGFQAATVNTYTYPSAFVGLPTVVASASFSSVARGWVSLADQPGASSVSLIAHSFTSGALIVPYYVALGRWF